MNEKPIQADDYMTQQLTEEMKEIQSIIDDVTPQVRPTITVDMFGKVFLPYFAQDENPQYPGVGNHHWLEIAKNPFQEVDVIDPSGQIVLTVPPLRDRTLIRPNDPTGSQGEHRHRLNAVLHQMVLLSGRSARDAERFFISEVQDRLKVGEENHPMIRYAQMWNRIYQYYGREKPFAIADEFEVDEQGKILKMPDEMKSEESTTETKSSSSYLDSLEDEDFESA